MRCAKRFGYVHAANEIPVLEDILLPSEFRRLQQYMKCQKAQCSAEAGTAFLCDVEHEYPFGGASSTAVPCLISHGKLVNASTKTLAIVVEHLLSMGDSREPLLWCQHNNPSERYVS